jgi:hypothetical protein
MHSLGQAVVGEGEICELVSRELKEKDARSDVESERERGGRSERKGESEGKGERGEQEESRLLEIKETVECCSRGKRAKGLKECCEKCTRRLKVW